MSLTVASSLYGPFGTSIAAWVLVPLALYLIGLGLGLLVERIARTPVPTGLLVPIGVCTAVVIVMPGYVLDAGAWLAAPLVAVCTVAGLGLSLRGLRARVRDDRYTVLAGLLVYGIYIAPVVLAGGWTWTGYNFVNDTSVHFLLADHLFHSGASIPAGPPKSPPYSTASEYIRVYLQTRYPLGSHALLATVHALVRAPIESIYQPVMASLAASAAMALAWLLRRVVATAAWAVGIAFVALSANLTYNYVLQGNIKEIAVLTALVVAAAAGRAALASEQPVRAIAVTALPTAAAIDFYSSAAIPYVGVLALVLLVAAFLHRASPLRRALIPAALVAALVVGVAAAPTLATVSGSAEVVKGTFSGAKKNTDLGQLLRPLPLTEAAGTWLTSDYRVAVAGTAGKATAAVIVVTLLLFAAGVVRCIRRRESSALLLLATMALTLAVIGPQVSPYAKGKMLALLAPTVVALAGLGCASLSGRLRPAAWVAAVVVAGGVLASNGLIYHRVQLAPVDRMEAMRDVGRHYAHNHGLMLLDEEDEFARYFMQPARVNVALDSITPLQALGHLTVIFGPLNADLDQMPWPYVEQFPLIIQRRGPDASRPPVNYRFDYQNSYYRVWRRVAPATDVLAHLPLQNAYEVAARASCSAVEQLKRQAGPRTALVASVPPAEVELDVARVRHSGGWAGVPTFPRELVPHTPGHAGKRLFFAGGTYRIWVVGSTGRPLTVKVDGRAVGRAVGVDTYGESLPAGVVRVPRGRHQVTIVRDGGSLAPGNGYEGRIGPVIFEQLPDRYRLLRAASPRALCGKKLDWVEAVRVG